MTPVQVVEDNQYVRNDETFSQELRLTYQTDDIQAVSGLYMSKLDVDDKASGERLLTFADIGLPPLEMLLTAPAEYGGFDLPAEFDKFDYVVQSTGATKDLAGRSFADSPEWTANIAINYDFGNGFTTNVSANYKDESYTYLDPVSSLDPAKYAIDSDPMNDSRVLINANVAYEWDNYQVRVDVRNLLDEEYISGYFFAADNNANADSYGQQIIGRPRQLSVTFLAEF
jgi:outer membrane receptor protein involved in Fe transport